MAGRNRFEFKRFAIDQHDCAMKVGTDGVLLGAWCRLRPDKDKAILDIGTGTGLIALQLAQRTEMCGATIDAVEIDDVSCRRAEDNFKRSLWSDRLRVYCSSVQEFAGHCEPPMPYDHIVTNPPWFVDSLSSPDTLRTIARHSYSLSYDDLTDCCFRLLKPGGRISLIVPAGAETEKMITSAGKYGFVVSRRTEVHSTPESGPKRNLLEFSHHATAQKNATEQTTLIIQDAGPGTFSAEYRALTRDFYLYF